MLLSCTPFLWGGGAVYVRERAVHRTHDVPYGLYEGDLKIGGEVICGNTSSQYRVVVKCTDELRGSSVNEFGPYVSSGNVSAKTCPDEGGTQWLATNIGYQVK